MSSGTAGDVGRLPAERSPLIGRADDLAALHAERLERDPRPITLTGAGGCGKTRLALAHAAAEQSEYAHGVRLVELAAIAQQSVVPNAVAAAIGLREQSELPLVEALVDHLAQREMLLIIDNCEHLRDAVAALIDRILDACPSIRAVATSRWPLNLPPRG